MPFLLNVVFESEALAPIPSDVTCNDIYSTQLNVYCPILKLRTCRLWMIKNVISTEVAIKII